MFFIKEIYNWKLPYYNEPIGNYSFAPVEVLIEIVTIKY